MLRKASYKYVKEDKFSSDKLFCFNEFPFFLPSNIIKYNPYGLIAFHVWLFYGWPISGNMTWASLKIYFVPIKYCLLSIVFDEFKNISENLGKSQLKMESPGIIWDSGQVAKISGSAINPNFNENKEMS